MSNFIPFARIAQETTLNGSQGSVTIASSDEQVSISGDMAFLRDSKGLASAKQLRDHLDRIIDELNSGSLSDQDAEIVEKDNPFT